MKAGGLWAMKRMSRIVSLIITISILASMLINIPITAADSKGISEETRNNLKIANEYVKKYWKIDQDIFGEYLNPKTQQNKINEELLNKGLKDEFENRQVEERQLIVYNEDGKKWTPKSRYLGLNIQGERYVNPFYPPDVSGITFLKALERYLNTPENKRCTKEAMGWIYRPWQQGEKKGVVDPKNPSAATVDFIDITFDSSIIDKNMLLLSFKEGLLRDSSYVKYMAGLKNPNSTKEFLDTFDQKSLDPNKKGVTWMDFIHIVQPPTYNTWGTGIMWHRGYNASGDVQLFYLSVPFAPFKYVEAKYGVVSSGFLNDGTTATIDFIDTSNFTSGYIGKLFDIYADFTDFMNRNNLSEDKALELYYAQGGDKETLEKAREIFKDIYDYDPEFSNDIILYTLFNNMPEKLFDAIRELHDLQNVSDVDLKNLIKYTAIDYRRFILLSLMDLVKKKGLENEYLKWLKNKDPMVLATGKGAYKINDTYYSLDPIDNKKALLDQIGIDRNLKNKINNKELGLIGYTTIILDAKLPNVQKDLLKQIVNEYTKDLVSLTRTLSINNTNTRVVAQDLLSKWNLNLPLNDRSGILNRASKYEIAVVENNSNSIYGEYDAAINSYRSIRINEQAIARMFEVIVEWLSTGHTKRDLIDKSGKVVSSEDIFRSTGARLFNEMLGIQEGIFSSEQMFTAEPDGIKTAESIFNATVETATMLALMDAGISSSASIKEDRQNNTIDVTGYAGVTITLYDKGIPLDLVVATRTEDGETIVLDIDRDYGVVVPNYNKILSVENKVTTTKNGITKTSKVKKATIKPAYIGLREFIEKANANYDKSVIDLGNTKVKFKNINSNFDKVEFSLTNADANAYYADKDNNRAAVVLFVEPAKLGPQQVNIIEDEHGNTESVSVVQPSISGNKVNVTVPTGTTLLEWKVSSELLNPLDKNVTWNAIVASLPTISSGTSANNITIDPNSSNVLYVRFRKQPQNNNVSLSGDLKLTQKMVTKAFDLTSIGNLTEFRFTYPTAGSHGHTVPIALPNGTPSIITIYYNRTTPIDKNYNYIIEYTNKLKEKIIGLVGVFAPTYNNTNSKSGTARWDGGGDTVKPNIYFTIWRGNDPPTIASYKESANHPLLSLPGIKIGKTSQTTRNTIGGYIDTIEFKLEKSSKGDYYTSFTDGDSPKGQTHTTSDTAEYKASVAVESYIGKPNTGNLNSSFVTSTFKAGGITFNKATGYAIPNTEVIKFYPYVEMLYELPMKSGGTKSVNILAAHESSITPVDYVDIGWFNSSPNNSLTINSNQWSTHKRAVDKYGKNSVLPGGAIFTLDTKNTQTKLAVVTWQTYIPQDQIGNVAKGDSYYTLTKANDRDTALNNDIKNTIENLNIVQYVDSDASKSTAFGGVKITGAAGQKVYGNTLSSDKKYKLVNNTNQNNANEADLDVINSTQSKTYYRLEATKNGEIVIKKSTNNSTWTTLETLTKTQTAANIKNAEVKELENRTRIVSNFIAALDRNQGNDPNNGGAWYNEAWDGICVVKTETIHTIGLKDPAVRTAALDPKLCPPRSSQSELFTKYYISQFRLNDKSTVRANEQVGLVAKFKGVDILIPDIQDMYRSRPFYIPNATVQDLLN